MPKVSLVEGCLNTIKVNAHAQIVFSLSIILFVRYYVLELPCATICIYICIMKDILYFHLL